MVSRTRNSQEVVYDPQAKSLSYAETRSEVHYHPVPLSEIHQWFPLPSDA